MKSIDKESFLLLLKVRPKCLFGKQIIYNKQTVGIVDISVSGDYLHIEVNSFQSTKWVPASSLDDHVIVDIPGIPIGTEMFTVASLTKSIETLENHVGQPGSEQTKPLFEIVAALNREVFELRQKIDEIELKENTKKD